ncbi:MAG: hypothetical protein ACRC80_15275 [Waterburya sp.]
MPTLAIALGEFDWSDYLETDTVIDSVEYWIAKFEENYFNRKDRNKKTETTWKDYQKIFKKFPDGASLTAESLDAPSKLANWSLTNCPISNCSTNFLLAPLLTF